MLMQQQTPTLKKNNAVNISFLQLYISCFVFSHERIKVSPHTLWICSSSTASRRLVLNSSTCSEMVRPSFSTTTFGVFGRLRVTLSSIYRHKQQECVNLVVSFVYHFKHNVLLWNISTCQGEKLCSGVHTRLHGTWEEKIKQSKQNQQIKSGVSGI